MTTETLVRATKLEKAIAELRAEHESAREKGTKRVHIDLYYRNGVLYEAEVDAKRAIDLQT